MPPRVRGERSTDTPRTQAAQAINRGLSPLGVSVDRPARPSTGPASALNADIQSDPFASAPPCLRF